MKEKSLSAQLCVVGGGIAGIAAAVTAARNGVKTVLVQDRNVLGGNASSEIRMWIRGACTQFPQYREGGIIEELALDNMHYNPTLNFSLWDAVLYNKVVAEKNLTLLLGTTCIGAKKEKDKILFIEAWQLNSYIKYRIEADYFADCSGDSVLSEFTDAHVMQGREGRAEYGEEMAPEHGDSGTMGNSCLMQLRRAEKAQRHIPFPFEREIPASLYKNRMQLENPELERENFWWVETGGTKDTVYEAADINRTLVSDIMSVWTGIEKKNPDLNWELDWVGFLQGKRESRRYRGDYVLNANDILEGMDFLDGIAYGGWTMDDHDPRGMYADRPNVNYYFKKPYAVPYRCIYSENIGNLFFAGRNISVTHMALSSTRVMATCGMLGQAVGAAVAVAAKYALSPREVGGRIEEVQRILADGDSFLPWKVRKTSAAMRAARCNVDGVLPRMTDSIERAVGENDPVVTLKPSETLRFTFPKTYCKGIRIVFDSDFARSETKDIMLSFFPMQCFNAAGEMRMDTPSSLVRDFGVAWKGVSGKKEEKIFGNFQRLVVIPVGEKIEEISFCGLASHGGGDIRLYSLDIIE